MSTLFLAAMGLQQCLFVFAFLVWFYISFEVLPEEHTFPVVQDMILAGWFSLTAGVAMTVGMWLTVPRAYFTYSLVSLTLSLLVIAVIRYLFQQFVTVPYKYVRAPE
jgi:hypothetical protein